MIETKAKLSRWEYKTQKYSATCRLANDTARVQVEFVSVLESKFEDVCEIELWMRERCNDPLTAEELAVEAATKWGLIATVTLHSHLHGPIVCTCHPPAK